MLSVYLHPWLPQGMHAERLQADLAAHVQLVLHPLPPRLLIAQERGSRIWLALYACRLAGSYSRPLLAGHPVKLHHVLQQRKRLYTWFRAVSDM